MNDTENTTRVAISVDKVARALVKQFGEMEAHRLIRVAACELNMANAAAVDEADAAGIPIHE